MTDMIGLLGLLVNVAALVVAIIALTKSDPPEGGSKTKKHGK